MDAKKEALNYKGHGNPSDPSTPPPYPKKIKVKDIERDVDYTRSHMDDVIDELAERLHPRQLVHDFVDIITGVPQSPEARQVSHTTGDALSGIAEKIRHDPLPFAVIGAGIAWLALSGGHHDGKSAPPEREDKTDSSEFEGGAQTPLSHAAEAPEYPVGYSRVGDFEQSSEPGNEKGSGGIGEKTEQKAQQAQQYLSQKRNQAGDYVSRKSSEAKDTLGEQANRGRERMSHMASDARHEAQSAAHTTRQGYRSARDGIAHTIEHNPIAAGAVALGVGALMGLLMPHTETEDRYLHEASERTKHNLASGAEQMTQAGKRVAYAAAASATDEARKEGVAPEQLAEQARRRSEGESASPSGDSPIDKAERIVKSGTEAAKKQSQQEQKNTDKTPL